MAPEHEAHSTAEVRPGRRFFFRASDCGLLAAILLSAVFTVMGISGKILEPEAPPMAGGARKIDAKKYEELIQKGILSGREALFFHAVEANGESRGGANTGAR